MPLLSAQSRKATVLAPPLPIRNSVFSSAGLVLRRRQSTILAAAPGVGKTLLATNIAVHTPVPTLYFSADSDEWTVKQRACSILSGTPLEQVEQQLNQEAWEEYYAGLLRATDHIDWCFESDVPPEFIVDRTFSFWEKFGEFPQLIIVDNMGNTVEDQDNEGSELRAACREFQRIARTTNAHVLATHHVTGTKENGTQPIYLGDLLYKLGKIPEVVLGMHWTRQDRSQLGLTVPKYRGGKSGLSLQLPVNYSIATIGGFR